MSHEVSVEFLQFCLATKAVGLGEAHSDPRARTQLISWIADGLVSDIVLELGGFSPAEIGGPDFMTTVSYGDLRWKNPIGLHTVVERALAKGVNVHCWDTFTGSADARNMAVAEAFRAHFGRGRYAVTQAAGTVVLYGADHFGPVRPKLNILLMGLNWADLSR